MTELSGFRVIGALLPQPPQQQMGGNALPEMLRGSLMTHEGAWGGKGRGGKGRITGEMLVRGSLPDDARGWEGERLGGKRKGEGLIRGGGPEREGRQAAYRGLHAGRTSQP